MIFCKPMFLATHKIISSKQIGELMYMYINIGVNLCISCTKKLTTMLTYCIFLTILVHIRRWDFSELFLANPFENKPS